MEISVPSSKKILFIGHTYHQKTKSSVFLLDMLKGKYDVTEVYIDPLEKEEDKKLYYIQGSRFEILIIWQVMPKLSLLRKIISWKKVTFFPMYDHYEINHGLYSEIWAEYEECLIVCFSKLLHDKLKNSGFDVRYIQYFPEPCDVKNWGDEEAIFFWQRSSAINLSTLTMVAQKLNIKKIHLHKAMDPGFEILPTSAYGEEIAHFFQRTEVTDSMWFERKEDMIKKMEEASLYMAPRHYEGIGMSFLEAMAHGRCVIAPNQSTMNEYIVDGVNGFLYDLGDEINIEKRICSFHEMQKNAHQTIIEGYKKWEKDKNKILQWIEWKAQPNKDKLKESALHHGWGGWRYADKSIIQKIKVQCYVLEMKYVIQCVLKGKLKNLFYFFIIHFNSRFKRIWYLMNYKDVKESGMAPAAHYLELGWRKGYNPSPYFSSSHYLKNNIDVANMGMCPLLHWKLIGKKEGRKI